MNLIFSMNSMKQVIGFITMLWTNLINLFLQEQLRITKKQLIRVAFFISLFQKN